MPTASPDTIRAFCEADGASWDARVDARFEEAHLGRHGDKAARGAPPPATATFPEEETDVTAWTAPEPGRTHVVALYVDTVPCGLVPDEPRAWSPRFGMLYDTARADVFVAWPDAGTPFHAVRVLDEAGFAAIAGPLEPADAAETKLRMAIGNRDRHAAIAAASARHLPGDFLLAEGFSSGRLRATTSGADLAADVQALSRALTPLDPGRPGGPRPDDFARYQRLAHGFVEALRAESARGTSRALTSYLVDALPGYGVTFDPAAPPPFDYTGAKAVLAAVEAALSPPPATLDEIVAARRGLPDPLPPLDALRLSLQARAPLARALEDAEPALAQGRYATAIGEASSALALGEALGIAMDPRLVEVEKRARVAFLQAVCPGPARPKDRAPVLAAIAALPIARGVDVAALETLVWKKGTVKFEEVGRPTLGAPTFVDGSFGVPQFTDGAAPVLVTPAWLRWKVEHELGASAADAGLVWSPAGEEPEPAQFSDDRPRTFVTTTPFYARAYVFPVSVRTAWTVDGERVEDAVSGEPIRVVRTTDDKAVIGTFTEIAARDEATRRLPSSASASSRPYAEAVAASVAAYVASRTGPGAEAEATWAKQVAAGR